MVRRVRKPIIFPAPVTRVLTRRVIPTMLENARKGGGSSSPPRPPQEAANDLRSEQFVRLLDVVSEGVIGGLVDGLKSVFVEGTPIENADGSLNFGGVVVQTTNGTPDQQPLSGFPNAELELNVNTWVTHDVPITKTVLSPDVNAVRVTISVPQLLENNPSTGDIMPCQVNYTIEYRPAGGGWAMAVNEYLSGKTNSKYQRSHYVKLTGKAPWDIRVTRATPDPTTSTVRNQLMWDTYTEIVETRLNYPNSALIGLQASAEQFQSIPKRRYFIDGLYIKVPSNYDPISGAYLGAWDGTFKLSVSSNPAWVFYDIVTNARYGLGEFVEQTHIDKWALYEIAQYCDAKVSDGKGGQERRFTCNVTINSAQEAFTLVNNIASIFRGMAYWSSGTIVASADKPADVTAIYSNANVIGGAFNYQGSDRRARHNVVLVSWNDPQLFGEPRIAYVEDKKGIAKYGVQQTEIAAFGCTTESQAIRMGRWLLYTEQLETEVVGFSVSLASAWVYPNAIIHIADASRSGERTGGRIVSVNNQEITLDAPISRDTELLTLSLPDDTITVVPIKQFVNDTTVTVYSPVMPEANSMWIGSRASLKPTTWRVLSVAEGNDGILEVSAIEHNPSKYDYIENNIELEEPPTTIVPNTPPHVEDLNLEEFLVYGEGATFSIRGLLSWESVQPLFIVRYRQVDGNYKTIETAVTSVELDLEEGAWEFEVTAVNTIGVRSDAVLLQQQVLGKQAPPTTVKKVQAMILPDNVLISWEIIPDIDLDLYEVRVGESWDTATVLGEAKVNYFYAPPMKVGSYQVHVRAKDYDGQYSKASAIALVTIKAPDSPPVNGSIVGGELILDWTLPKSDHRVEQYEVWREVSASRASKAKYKKRITKNKIGKGRKIVNYANANLELVAVVGSLNHRLLVDWGGSRVFHVRAVDVAKNAGLDGISTVTINNPVAPDPRAQVIDNNVLLRWSSLSKNNRLMDRTSINGRLPVQYYNLRSALLFEANDNPPFADAKDLGRISGEFTVVYEMASGLYRYFVQAVDTAGNVSDVAYVDARVNQPPDFVLWTEIESTLDEPNAWDGSAVRATNGWVAPVMGGSLNWGTHFEGNKWDTISDQLATVHQLYREPELGGGESWKTHYEENGWQTPKDHVDAGFPIYLQPTSLSGAIYEYVFDYGAPLPSLKFDLLLDFIKKVGNPTYTFTLATRQYPTDAWLDAPTSESIIVPENTQYVKVRIHVESDGDRHSYALIRRMTLTLAAKFVTDQGDVEVALEGTTVKFNQRFVDVINVVATAKGTEPIYCVVDFLDTPYPENFIIYAFDVKGKPVACRATWTARGF